MIPGGDQAIGRPALAHEPVHHHARIQHTDVAATTDHLHGIAVASEVEDRVESLVAHATRVERMRNKGTC